MFIEFPSANVLQFRNIARSGSLLPWSIGQDNYFGTKLEHCYCNVLLGRWESTFTSIIRDLYVSMRVSHVISRWSAALCYWFVPLCQHSSSAGTKPHFHNYSWYPLTFCWSWSIIKAPWHGTIFYACTYIIIIRVGVYYVTWNFQMFSPILYVCHVVGDLGQLYGYFWSSHSGGRGGGGFNNSPGIGNCVRCLYVSLMNMVKLYCISLQPTTSSYFVLPTQHSVPWVFGVYVMVC